MSKYDLIGDIHGRPEELKALLDELGYKILDGVYSHPEGRQAIFIGDFVNKGPDSKGVIEIIRPMVESGNAQAIIGNHELNVIAMGTKKPDGEPIIPHSEIPLKVNAGFIKDYPLGSDEYEDIVNWFKSLPVYIDLPDFRVVHACWDDEQIEVLDRYLEDDNSLGDKAMGAYRNMDQDFLQAMRAVIIGPFYRLDDDMIFEDFNGKSTQYARILWWSPSGTPDEVIDFQGRPLDEDTSSKLAMKEKLKMDFMKSSKPTFIGHYYLPGPARELSNDIIGLDFREQVTAYRWNGPKEEGQNEFVVISAKPQ